MNYDAENGSREIGLDVKNMIKQQAEQKQKEAKHGMPLAPLHHKTQPSLQWKEIFFGPFYLI